ncbi:MULTISPECIES: hypothetical protein [Corallococcus]|uniref:hypothetical protein n=1 Tax=Corallococcus TaxID=83461 RepID=UPI0011C3961B|nr:MULTISPECIES: hypothetical protein [Corallococcus]NPD24417.1 hypothetical protein [Corallococcus exiguus]NRD44439.1 hypothetical protein [Corallococcus exiguus]
MRHWNRGSQWLGAVALVVGTMTVGCGGGSQSSTTDATSDVSQAVEATSDSSDAVEVSSLLHGLDKLRPQAIEGFHCDESPDITTVEVCGKTLPATVHLEWTDCAPPTRPEGPGRGGGQPPGGGGGGGQPPGGGDQPPPPQGGEGSQVRGQSFDGGNGGGKPGGKGPGGPTSGTVDIVNAYEASEDCTGAVTQSQTVTFEVSGTNSDGEVSTVKGTTSSTAELVDGAPPQRKSTQADVTRTRTDAAGTVVQSVRLEGSLSVAFSTDTPPVRTIDGAYTETALDGSQGTVTLAGIVRPSREVCPWPTSGTLTRTTADGASHVLTFGPECGDGTLDGAELNLPDRCERGGGRH